MKPTAQIPTPEERQSRAQEQLSALARRIRALRERLALTQEDFADRCGISVSFASLLERGERTPSYETLVDLAEALEVTLPELFKPLTGEPYDDPYYARLVDFARRTRLSRGQVDRLIAVGTAMFELSGQGDPAGGRRTNGDLRCVEEDCEKPVLAKGMCASHYHRARRARS